MVRFDLFGWVCVLQHCVCLLAYLFVLILGCFVIVSCIDLLNVIYGLLDTRLCSFNSDVPFCFILFVICYYYGLWCLLWGRQAEFVGIGWCLLLRLFGFEDLF